MRFFPHCRNVRFVLNKWRTWSRYSYESKLADSERWNSKMWNDSLAKRLTKGLKFNEIKEEWMERWNSFKTYATARPLPLPCPTPPTPPSIASASLQKFKRTSEMTDHKTQWINPSFPVNWRLKFTQRRCQTGVPKRCRPKLAQEMLAQTSPRDFGPN